MTTKSQALINVYKEYLEDFSQSKDDLEAHNKNTAYNAIYEFIEYFVSNHCDLSLDESDAELEAVHRMNKSAKADIHPLRERLEMAKRYCDEGDAHAASDILEGLVR